jgi:HlyD family secretion protein
MWFLIAAIFIGTMVYLFVNSRSHTDVYELISPTTEATISKNTLLTGSIEPRDEIAVKPQISGIIAEIMVKAGDMVKVGDVIARIKVIPDESQLSSAENRVKTAAQALELATSKFNRTSQLYNKKYASREEYEEAENTLRNAQLELSAAKDALSIVRDGVSSTNAQGSNTLVRATITGLVLDVPVKVGASVIQSNTFNDGTTIATIADMNNLIFKGKVDETEVGLLSVGTPMTITIGALQDVELGAAIEYISPKATSENGTNTFEIKAAISNVDSQTMRSGYSANASVELNAVKGVMSVPESTLEFEGNNTFVYVLTDSVPSQKFERRQVETGLSDGINIEVKSGISATDKLRGNKTSK